VACSLTRHKAGRRSNDSVIVGDRVFAVADGIDTGSDAGSEALQEIVQRLGSDPLPQVQRLRDAFRGAYVALWFREDKAHAPRSTVTIAVWFGTLIGIAHIGDSRAYLIDRTGVTQLTTDQATADGQERGVTRLGHHQRPPDPEIRRVRVLSGDRLVLCTDGLWRHLAIEDLRASTSLTAQDACQALCAAVPDGDEEASVVIVDFTDIGSAT
jgi:PPM family protein phosphatase